MNRKLVIGAVAGVAAVALAYGGTTYSAWSDFGNVTGNDAQAGILKLNVAERTGSTSGVDALHLAPGQNKFQEFFLASADADNVPVGHLTAGITNLSDTEDAATCTTNSEAVAEGSPVDASGNPTHMDACGSAGELSSQATVQILVSDPVADASSCPNTGIYHSASPSGSGTLAANAGKVFDLGNVSKGQGVCVRMEMSLPSGATNATQGDAASFDWHFALEQV